MLRQTPLLCFFTEKSTGVRVSSFVSAFFNDPRDSKKIKSRHICLSLLHSRVFRVRAFLYFCFLFVKKNFTFFFNFFYAREESLYSYYYFLRYVISGIIEFTSSQVNYPQERDLSRNRPFIGDNFAAVEKLRYS